MEAKMMLIVSGVTHDRTTADSARPTSENRQTTVRSGQIVATGMTGRGWTTRVDICHL